ncbi:hypothetical protein MOO44_07845 [Nicoliella spurrieriana]|uniref:Uncharacterized protein n=1 Tax=Nicoliella spurrieriana TaxID=2925830 RepID=A0A976RS60_9LACO|nr:hypothetical protein [Nicoliella spurrieriana]UQS86770.1 hypothetical protein MOO44_07845 [Nicoliella spurrieriana]
MLRSRDAFTVLESLIVLGVTVMILGIGLFAAKGFDTGKIQERIFWQSFQKHWQFSERYAVETHSAVSVTFFHNHVMFIYGNGDSPPYRIRYPKGLVGVKGKDEIIIKDNGHVSPKTIWWQSKNNQRTVKQTFQLGWGVYRVKYE